MKKLVGLILALALTLFSVAAFAHTDYSVMTDDELEQIIQAAQAELDSRKASSDAAAMESDGMVTIKEAGFEVAKGDALYYSFIAHSNLSDKAIKSPEFKIVVRDAEGGLISTKSQMLHILYPGQDIMFGNYGMSVEGENPASIEVEFVEPDQKWRTVDPSNTDYPGYQPIVVNSAKFKEASTSFQDNKIVGEFTNPNSFDIDQVAVTALFRDGDGKLLGGVTTYINGAKAGKATAFEIDFSQSLTADNYEVFIQPW